MTKFSILRKAAKASSAMRFAGVDTDQVDKARLIAFAAADEAVAHGQRVAHGCVDGHEEMMAAYSAAMDFIEDCDFPEAIRLPARDQASAKSLDYGSNA